MPAVDDWETAKETVRERIDFVGLVEEYVTLEERGQGYWGLCPFHSEDTPSFSVTPSMGIYKCFGCGAGGDVFDFYMEIESCDFSDALRRLADRVGVELPSSGEESSEDSLSNKLFDVNEYACEKYREAFNGEVGQQARSYMLDRGYTEETLDKFDVGYAPEGWRNLTKALKRDGYDLTNAFKAGLIRKSDDGSNIYDTFRDRVIFPIRNLSGYVVAFGGRILDGSDQDSPKYVNSPESPIFQKRETLYGLTQARSSIRETGRCLMMEGYTDVMMCHQEGYDTAVATLGTALTEHHAQVLKRYLDEIVLIYDGDESGQRAAKRGGRIALEEGIKTSVIILSEDQDPADLLQESPDRFQELLDNRRSYLTVLFDWLVEAYSLDDAASKEKIMEEFTPLVRSISSRVKREETISWLAEKLELRESLVRKSLQDQDSSSSKKPGSQTRPTASHDNNSVKGGSGELIEEVFFRCLVFNPDVFEDVMDLINVKDFAAETNKELMRALVEIRENGEQFTPENWLDHIPEDKRRYLAGILSQNDESRLARGLDPLEVARKLKTLDSAERELQELSRELAQQDDRNGPGEFDESKKVLLKEVMNLKAQEEPNPEANSE
ncbi:MAG: DNA primase [bacterium]